MTYFPSLKSKVNVNVVSKNWKNDDFLSHCILKHSKRNYISILWIIPMVIWKGVYGPCWAWELFYHLCCLRMSSRSKLIFWCALEGIVCLPLIIECVEWLDCFLFLNVIGVMIHFKNHEKKHQRSNFEFLGTIRNIFIPRNTQHIVSFSVIRKFLAFSFVWKEVGLFSKSKCKA